MGIKVLSDAMELKLVNTWFVSVDGVPLQVQGSAVVRLPIQALAVN